MIRSTHSEIVTRLSRHRLTVRRELSARLLEGSQKAGNIRLCRNVHAATVRVEWVHPLTVIHGATAVFAMGMAFCHQMLRATFQCKSDGLCARIRAKRAWVQGRRYSTRSNAPSVMALGNTTGTGRRRHAWPLCRPIIPRRVLKLLVTDVDRLTRGAPMYRWWTSAL